MTALTIHSSGEQQEGLLTGDKFKYNLQNQTVLMTFKD